MTGRGAALLVILLALAGPGAAAERRSAVLADCAAAYLPAEPDAAGRACIGSVSGPCLRGPQGQTTLGMVDCLAAESEGWDRLLNRDWPKLMRAARAMDRANRVEALGLPDFAAAQRAAQRAWLAWRETECAARRAAWGGGSHGRVVAADCWLRLTARRTLSLRARLMELPQ